MEQLLEERICCCWPEGGGCGVDNSGFWCKTKLNLNADSIT